MSHKDYVKFASALAHARADLSDDSTGRAGLRVIEQLEADIADIFAVDNPRFDRHRFMMAAFGTPTTGRDRPR